MTRNDANILSSIASQTSPRGRLESLDSGVEGLEGLDQMDHLSKWSLFIFVRSCLDLTLGNPRIQILFPDPDCLDHPQIGGLAPAWSSH